MQSQRLFQILHLLLTHKHLTAKDLAERLEVSARTILRDMDALCIAGIPLCSRQGHGGGFSLLEPYVLDRTLLSSEEQDQLLLALQSLTHLHPSESSHALTKLSGLFQKKAGFWLEVDFSRWGHIQQDEERFSLIKNAILKEHALAFRYFSAKGEQTDCRVYPLALLWKNNAWYVKAFSLSKSDYRLYRITRIQSLSFIEETFSRSDFSYPPPAAVKESVPPLVAVTLSFSPSAAYRAYDEFSPESMTHQPDGSILVQTQLPIDPWFFSYLLSLGGQAEIIAPVSLRKEMAHRLQEILLFYQKS